MSGDGDGYIVEIDHERKHAVVLDQGLGAAVREYLRAEGYDVKCVYTRKGKTEDLASEKSHSSDGGVAG